MGAAGLTLCHKNGDLLPIPVMTDRVRKSHEHCEPGVNLQGNKSATPPFLSPPAHLRESMKQPCWDCQQQESNEKCWKVSTRHDPSSAEKEIPSWKHFIISDRFALVQKFILAMVILCSKNAAVGIRKLSFLVVS
jgi:hypothetical protein